MTSPDRRRRVEPLAPPPGRFDSVMAQARSRRYQRATAACGITGVFLAGIVGGLSLGGGVTGVRDRILAVAGDAAGPAATSPAPAATSPDQSSQASVVPPTGGTASSSDTAGAGAASAADTAAATSAAPEAASSVLRGRVVDPAGAPVAGVYVWTGQATAAGGFLPDRAVTTTDAKGRYEVSCSGAPVLVTSWPVNRSLGTSATGTWAATFVDDARCSAPPDRRVTVLQRGGVVEGRVQTDVGCPDVRFPLWLWLGGDRGVAVRLGDLAEGDRYLISGAPDGTSVLGARGRTTSVTVEAGGTVEQDVTFACPSLPAPTPDPTTTPLPTPSETPTAPSGSATTPAASGSTATGSAGAAQRGGPTP